MGSNTPRTIVGPILGNTGQYHRQVDGLIIDGHVTLDLSQPATIPVTRDHDLFAGHVVALFDHPSHGTWCVAVVDAWDDGDPRRSFSLSTSTRPTTGDVGITHARADYHAVRLNEVSLVERPGGRGLDEVTVAHGDVRLDHLGHPFTASSWACQLLDAAHAYNLRRFRDDPIEVQSLTPATTTPATTLATTITRSMDDADFDTPVPARAGVHRRLNSGTIAAVY